MPIQGHKPSPMPYHGWLDRTTRHRRGSGFPFLFFILIRPTGCDLTFARRRNGLTLAPSPLELEVSYGDERVPPGQCLGAGFDRVDIRGTCWKGLAEQSSAV